MSWRSKLFSAANDEMDLKAVLAVVATVIALLMYLAYGLKGLWVKWDMPASIRDITVALIIGGVATAGATLLNQKLGVSPAPGAVPGPAQGTPETPPAKLTDPPGTAQGPMG